MQTGSKLFRDIFHRYIYLLIKRSMNKKELIATEEKLKTDHNQASFFGRSIFCEKVNLEGPNSLHETF